MTAFHKLEPTKIGERFVKDAGPISSAGCRAGATSRSSAKRRTKTDLSARRCPKVQAAHLDAVPLSFLALRIGDEMFFVPWRAIPWETLRTAESVTTASLSA